MADVIALSNVTVRHNSQTILDGIDLSVPKGSMTILLGATGTGKTTLFRVLTGEIVPSSGSVKVGETEIASLRGAQLAKYRRSIGIVFQDAPILDDRDIESQLLLPLELSGMPRQRRIEHVNALIARFQLESVRSLHQSDVSMGMRQRIAIARAVVTEPLVLLADEPAAHLDFAAQQEISQIFQRENLRGMTILIATSNEQFATYFPAASIQQFQPLAQHLS